jgi:hyperosmotically inducible periplasmic protein
MQILLIAFILVLSHEVISAETTGPPPASSETTRTRSVEEKGGVAGDTEKEVTPGAEKEGARDPENTGVNVRDRDAATVTPEEQGGEPGDREITAAVRRAIVKDDSLSLNAHNVKIITRDGTVTLRGPVESTAERTTIGQLAEKTAGVKRVDNQLEINAD